MNFKYQHKKKSEIRMHSQQADQIYYAFNFEGADNLSNYL